MKRGEMFQNTESNHHSYHEELQKEVSSVASSATLHLLGVFVHSKSMRGSLQVHRHRQCLSLPGVAVMSSMKFLGTGALLLVSSRTGLQEKKN